MCIFHITCGFATRHSLYDLYALVFLKKALLKMSPLRKTTILQICRSFFLESSKNLAKLITLHCHKRKVKSCACHITYGFATRHSRYDLYTLVLPQKLFKNCPHHEKLQSSNIAKIWQSFSALCVGAKRKAKSDVE